MTMSTKKEVLREHLSRYLKVSREEKKKILDSLTDTLGMHRKAVNRALKREQMRDSFWQGKKPGRKVIYGPDVTPALKEVWEIGGEICAERLHPMTNEYVRILERDQMWHYGSEVTGKLRKMSLATIKRRIGKFQRIKAGGGYSTTKPSDLKEIIPIRTGPWDNPHPGYGEIDTVVHCGSSLLGNMAYTVNFTDITTTWIESAAQINKGQERTLKSIKAIRSRLPFPLKGLDPDTGSEFINWHTKGWCDQEKIELTRSRPNHRNDNAHVEQKNYAGVRKFLGYSRIETQAAVRLMNQLYSGPLRLYLNFFQPSMKCVKKIRIGSKYVRKYNNPKTPFQRVLNHKKVDQAVKDELAKTYETLNPLKLKREIDLLIDRIFKVERLRKRLESR